MGYTVAKSALLGVVRALSAEFADQNVRVNGIAPGWIAIPLYRGARGADPARKAKASGRIQMGRIGEVEDVGWTCVFLASDAAACITGQAVAVDGRSPGGHLTFGNAIAPTC
ncbi:MULTISPECIES: SDR family oxidoreductase [unclassified Paracoccus (in: a-proteobacteria)]|uniref:SDR family oxidoreductase n=1 Tax=unclassified Paracoccus (in: a-proteobacteria) TaxID=2688777 RepID=UPI00048AF412|nr:MULTISPECIES: SDR family oxidoreductase [unclassified Paracoccus (in: a-proteobacteria)]